MAKYKYDKVLFRLYLFSIILLMMIRTDGKIKLAKTILGVRGDHFVHATLFIPYMLFIGVIYYQKTNVYLLRNKLFYAIGFGAFCESIHLFLPYRTFSIFDFFANCFGIGLGMVLWILIKKILAYFLPVN